MSNASARISFLKAGFLVAGLGAASLGLATTGHTLPLKITLLGNVTSSELPAEFPTDAPTKFTVTYDPALPVTFADPTGISIYSSPTSVWNIQVGSYVTSAVGGSFVVHNNFLNKDAFIGSVIASPGNSFGVFAPGSAVGGVPLFQASFALTDTTATMFNSVALPTSAFSGYDDTLMMLDFFILGGAFGSDLQIRSNIYSFTIESAASSETPLPAALPLFASGLGILGFIVRRRKQATLAA